MGRPLRCEFRSLNQMEVVGAWTTPTHSRPSVSATVATDAAFGPKDAPPPTRLTYPSFPGNTFAKSISLCMPGTVEGLFQPLASIGRSESAHTVFQLSHPSLARLYGLAVESCQVSSMAFWRVACSRLAATKATCRCDGANRLSFNSMFKPVRRPPLGSKVRHAAAHLPHTGRDFLVRWTINRVTNL
jgi:hypothetical protein